MRERINGRIATEATLAFQAVAAAWGGGAMLKDFNKSIKDLNDGD